MQRCLTAATAFAAESAAPGFLAGGRDGGDARGNHRLARQEERCPSEILSKEKFQHYLSTHIKDSAHDKETRAEELALKMFGLVPQDFNLAKETEDLLGEQAAAFYDYKKKRLYIIDSTPAGEEQQMALVHELAHALADQQHSLGKYLNQGSPDSDESTAREAVMEGQATWLTWAYEAKRAGGKGEVPAQNARPINVRA